MKNNNRIENNFYFNIPIAVDNQLVNWSCKNECFEWFYIKCGEAIKQTVEERTMQEGANTAGLTTLYQFYLPIDKINKAFNENRTNHFDELIFGHQSLKKNFKNTIFNFFNSKKIDCKQQNTNFRYGREYIDISDDFNIWLKDHPDEIINIKNYQDNIMIYEVAKRYFNDVMPSYLNLFSSKILNYKISKSKVILRDYQKKVFDLIKQLIINNTTKIIAELPPRWGKTILMLKLFCDCIETDILIVFSYVKTVNSSYSKACNNINFGEEIQLIDINNKYSNNINNIKNGIKTVITINTTGDEDKCMLKRIENLNNIIKKLNVKPERIMYLNEEADFGNHTEKSAKKIKMFNISNESIFISVTGTDAYKADNVVDNGHHIVVNLNNWNEIRYTGINIKA